MTFVAGIVAFFVIVDFPDTAKFLTAEVREFVVWRLATDRSSVGEDKRLKRAQVWSAAKDPQVWLSIGYYAGMCMPVYSVALFLPSIIAGLAKWTRSQSQLLTVPVYATATIWVVSSAILSDRLKRRWAFMIVDQLLRLVGIVLNITYPSAGVRYFGMFLLASGSYAGLATSVAWLSNNLSGQTRRGVGSAMQIGVGNFGGLVASNVYRSKDAPRFILGHAVVVGFVGAGMLFGAPAYAWWLWRQNARKRAVLAEQEAGTRPAYSAKEVHELGDRAPDFNYTI